MCKGLNIGIKLSIVFVIEIAFTFRNKENFKKKNLDSGQY